jgi:hypothetical protein
MPDIMSRAQPFRDAPSLQVNALKNVRGLQNASEFHSFGEDGLERHAEPRIERHRFMSQQRQAVDAVTHSKRVRPPIAPTRAARPSENRRDHPLPVASSGRPRPERRPVPRSASW